MTVIYHLLAHYSAPTTPGEVFRPFWTKSELLTLPRDWFTSKKALQRPKWALWDVPQKHDFVIWPWFIAPGPITALPQHQGSCSAHFGPSLSSQLFLGSDLGPKTPFWGRFWAPKKSVYLWGTNKSTYSRQDEYLRLSNRPEGSIGQLENLSEVRKVKNRSSGVPQGGSRRISTTPPLKTSRWRGLKWPNLNFEKKLSFLL